MTPPVPGSSERRVMVERRARLERRVGERRFQFVPVSRERRQRPARRSFDRRESGAGHVRNAVQLLEGVVEEHDMTPELDKAVRKAIERLWLGLREIERLAAARARLGLFVRRVESRPDPDLDFPFGL